MNYLDGLVGVGNEGDEERQHHVDEQRDEGVEVGAAENPHQSVFVLQLGKGGEHVVAIQQGEKALGHTAQALELEEVTLDKKLTQGRNIKRVFLQHKTILSDVSNLIFLLVNYWTCSLLPQASTTAYR